MLGVLFPEVGHQPQFVEPFVLPEDGQLWVVFMQQGDDARRRDVTLWHSNGQRHLTGRR